MKRAILLLVVLVGGAFYLGWFTFTTDSTGHTEHVNIEINKDKVHEDEARAVEKLHSYENQIEEQNHGSMTNLPGNEKSADLHQRPRMAPAQALKTEPVSDLASVAAGYGSVATEVAAKPARRNRPVGETSAESFSRGFQ